MRWRGGEKGGGKGRVGKITRRALVARLGDKMVRETKRSDLVKRKCRRATSARLGWMRLQKKNKRNTHQRKRVFEAHAAHLGSQNIADKPLVACLDSESVGILGNTQDKLLELVLGR